MALRHETLLDDSVQQNLQDRLARLNGESQARWGRMSVSQMLHHVSSGLRMATGDLAIPPIRSPLRFFPLKHLIVFVLPFVRNAPTSPLLMAREEFDFEAERRTAADLISAFSGRTLTAWPDHPLFGSLDREQWGVMAWKHVDHHFRQFGV